MARTWFHYSQWEDWAAGMYGLSVSEESIQRAVEVLSDARATEDDMRRVVVSWPTSVLYRLTAAETNRRAWVGQAACCLAARCTQAETCAAWRRLTDIQRARANRCAETIIAEWEDAHRGQTLLVG